MPSKEDGEQRPNDDNHTGRGQRDKEAEDVALLDAAALEKVNLWSEGMLAVRIWAP
jgi:hypothetical protein